jgi:hypothetical protein
MKSTTGPTGTPVSRESKVFLFEKKMQKLLIVLAAVLPDSTSPDS